MMRYAGIIYNDFAGAPGVSLTFYTQGCNRRCYNCHNPQTWDFDGGKEFSLETLSSIIKGLTANGIHRKLCIQGGEPLCEENLFLTNLVISEVKKELPDTKIFIWTGYLYEEIKQSSSPYMKSILEQTDVIIDGPYIDEERDITLPMRGSRNQCIYDVKRDRRIDFNI